MPRPRVTSSYTSSPVSSPLAASLRVPTIVGEGATTFTITEQVIKGASGGTDTLAHTATAILRVGNYSTTTDYQLTTDYLLTGGAVNWSPAGTEPVTGAKYFVTYKYAKVTADFGPKMFDNFNDILNAYGPVLLDNNNNLLPQSYITMAAQIMMGPGIGAQRLIVSQINPATAGAPVASDFTGALVALQNSVGPQNVDPYYLTPLGGKLSDSDVALVNAAYLNHCIQMADPQFRKERRVYTGLKSTASYNAIVSAAQALGTDQVNSSRLTLAANFDPQLTVSAPNNPVITLDGFFQAAAIAAFRSTQVASQPALNKLLPAFDGYGTTFSSTQIDTLDDVGAMVCEAVAGTISMVNDVTVNIVNDIEKSIPTVETRDVLIGRIRRRLKAAVIGLRGGPTIPAQIEQITDSELDSSRGSGDIQAFAPAKANRVPNTTTKFAVSFSYLPAGEVLEINVNFSIDLNLV